MSHGRSRGGFCVLFSTSPAGTDVSLQALQLSVQISRTLMPLVSILLECPIDDFFQSLRDIGIDASNGNRGTRQNRLDNNAARGPAKRLAPCRHFIQQQTEREDIRARVQIVSTDLLR